MTRRLALLTLLFTALTAVMTFPQVLRLRDGVGEHFDPFFSIWRLAWFAHASKHSPDQWFNGNIFYPEPATLTFSDAMPLQGTIATPLLWSGVHPALVYNLLLLAGFAFSGVATAVLVRSLTNSIGPAIFAGIVFAFVPYRFDHYIHLELQWIAWAPLALWAAHACARRGRLRDGVLMGAFTALQALSSIYYGIFLLTNLAGFVPLLLLRSPCRRRATLAFLAGGLLLAVVLFVYSRPYVATAQRHGFRDTGQVANYSATPANYLATSWTNVLYGRFTNRFRFHDPEKALFPGATATALALVAVWPPLSTVRSVYAIAALLAFDGSLGVHGFTYPFLYDHFTMYRGLRVPARLGIFVALFIAVLAGFGGQRLTASCSNRARAWVWTTLCAVALAEYAAIPFPLQRVPPVPTTVYAFLQARTTGPIVEFPLGDVDDPNFTNDAVYMYFSTTHWLPLLNGYSGFYPRSYMDLLAEMHSFPDRASLAYLRHRKAQYLLLHRDAYDAATYRRIQTELSRQKGVPLLGTFREGRQEIGIYRLDSE